MIRSSVMKELRPYQITTAEKALIKGSKYTFEVVLIFEVSFTINK